MPPHTGSQAILFELNFSANLFELLLEGFSVSFGEAFLNNRGSTVNHLLSLFQAKTGEFLNSLNYLEFGGTGGFENYVEAGFLLSGGSTGGGAGSNCYGSSGGVDTILVLQDLSEFVYFFYGQVNQLFCKSF